MDSTWMDVDYIISTVTMSYNSTNEAMTLRCEHANVSLRVVSKDCVSPQIQNLQNDVISREIWLKNQRSTFFSINSIFIENDYFPMTVDFRLNKPHKVLLLHV